MFDSPRLHILGLVLMACGCHIARAESQSASGAACVAAGSFFADEVWAKVGGQTCLKCHHANGDAAESRFILEPTLHDSAALLRNHKAFVKMAKAQKDGKPRMLLKVTNQIEHEGGVVLKSNATGYRILKTFVERVQRDTKPKSDSTDKPAYLSPPFFDGVEMISPRRLLRRTTLSLAGRLPTDKEQAAVDKHGLDAMDVILDQLLKEDAFYVRLKEAFNDIFLTSFPGNDTEVYAWEHFPNRLWYQKHDLSTIPGSGTDQRARWHLADVYRQTIKREPLELIEYIVRHDRPFTEIVTADYIMVSPYTARGYGVFDKVRKQYKNEHDPFEYVPVRLPAMKTRKGKPVQESKTGYYPHAGFLSMFHYLRRYPTTETNRNRLRARMYYKHFLGVDVMALAPRVSDAAAITAKYEIPTMQAADCVACHKSVDPVAGLFQEYNEKGHFGPRKDGWYTDMFEPGLDGEKLPEEERWRAMQWLGERTAKDPRFAVAMVEHVYYILMGRHVLNAPQDIDDPNFNSRRQAYRQQRLLIETTARQFAKKKFDLKFVFKAIIHSEFYRADGLATAIKHPRREAELDDVGLVRLLTPEQLERKIKAIFGQPWGRLVGRESKFHILYGGIDSQAVTERMTEPSGAMGAIQRILANDVACKNVAVDFSKKPEQRRLFPQIELNVLPGEGPKSEKKIRHAIIHLHELLLGRTHGIDHPEVDRTCRLFAGIIEDARNAKGIEKDGSYFCDRINEKRLPDPHYTLRAWRGVVTYLLRQHDFLYE